MSVETLAGIAAVILSLAFSYVPKLSVWYDALDKGAKQAVMGGLLLVVTVVIYVLACANVAADFGLAVTCDRKGAIELVNVLIYALVANQGAYLITRR